MMKYTQVYPARLTPTMGAQLREYAAENDMPESVIIRVALREFFTKPRDRVRIRAPRKIKTGGERP